MVGLSASELPVETLFPGDTIEYFSMAFVAGDRRGHRIAKILRINHRDNEYPVEVDTQEMLPMTMMLKRKQDRRNADISSDDAKWRKLRTFRLEDGQITSVSRAERLNAGLTKSILDAMKSTKKKVAIEKQEESNARSNKLMQMFLTKTNAVLDEDETMRCNVLDKMVIPEREKKGRSWSRNTDHCLSVQPHNMFGSTKSHDSGKTSWKSRRQNVRTWSEQKCKHDSKKHKMRKRKRSASASLRSIAEETRPRIEDISSYFSGEQTLRRFGKKGTTKLSKFMHRVQETDNIEKIEEQKRIVWGLDEYYALEKKRKVLETADTERQDHVRKSSSSLMVSSGKTS